MTTADRLIGQILGGKYRLEAVIATGSTAIVYRGSDPDGEPRAIKVIYGAFTANAQLMERFAHAARAQLQLDHPHVVKGYDLVAEGGTYAIVMELLEGVGLDQLLYEATDPLPWEQIHQLIAPVLDAVAYAHDQGVTHHDLKPSNILVPRRDGAPFPKVMDFGIASVLAEGSSATAPGAMLSRLLFMSPEQCKALKSVDARSDIYALGVTLYQMATGMVPFYAESAFEIMLAHVQTPPTAPRELVPSVPPDLEAVIARALSKDPEDRYQTVGELATALEQVGTGEIAAAAPTTESGVRRLRSWRADEDMSALENAVFSAPNIEPRRARGNEQTTEREPAPPPPETLATREPSPPRAPTGPTPQWRRQRGAATGPLPPAGRQRAVTGPLPAGQRRAATGPVQPGGRQGRPLRESVTEVVGLSDYMAGALRLKLRIGDRDDWLRFYDPNIAGGGVFCPTPDPPRVGTPVRLEIVFTPGPRFFVRGAVTWRRPALNDPRARAGAGVQVHPSERAKIAYVNSWVHGRVDDRRGQRRLPVKLRVTYSARAGRRINFTRDLNEEGIFVRSRELPEVGTKIRLLLLAPDPGRSPFRLEGTVSRRVDDREDRGMGIKLRFDDQAEQQAYTAFVDELEQRFLAGDLPDDVVN